MRSIYKDSMYKDRHQKTLDSAETILSLVLESLPPVHSAVDFGCGVGTWLSILQGKGINKVQGFDGPWVNKEFLEIPEDSFCQVDLSQSIRVETKYDLAMSLEVAEHLPINCASNFVDSLVSASDFILFSAAIPFQGGKGHVNEQWQSYWCDLFNDQGYLASDSIRKQIWDNDSIPVWYRQNIFLFVNQNRAKDVNLPLLPRSTCDSYSVVHPEMYTLKMDQAASVSGSLKFLRRAITRPIKKRLKAIFSKE